MLIGQALRLVALAVERWQAEEGDTQRVDPAEKVDLLTLEEERTRDLLRSRGFRL
jgi:hypothetical protein